MQMEAGGRRNGARLKETDRHRETTVVDAVNGEWELLCAR